MRLNLREADQGWALEVNLGEKMIENSLYNQFEKLDAEHMSAPDDDHTAIARLLELGRKKRFVTIDDILSFFPDAEPKPGIYYQQHP